MKKATRIKLFDGNGNELNDYKAIANEAQETEIFSVVKNGYQIIQHEDVYKTVEDAIADKNLNADIRPNPLYDGNCGRLHIEVTFPEISLDVENDGLQSQLYCTYDNSYDGTTGLRLSVGAKRGNAVLWIVGSRYYHKHTKSVSVAAFEESLEKGIESFQTKIKGHFMGMFKTPVNETGALSFLDTTLEMKGVSKKYVEAVISKVKQSTIKNKWQLYCVICDVITKEASSIDVRDRHLKALISKMHRVIKSSDEKVESPATPEGGATLKEVAEKQMDGVTFLDEINSKQGPSLIVSSPKLTIDKKGKRKFAVMMGDTELKIFKKYRQASKFVQKAA